MGLFGRKGPDRRLLKLDNRFTTAARNEERDPAGAATTYRRVLSDLNAVSGLSSEDDAYRQRLISILERGIKDLD